MTTKPGMVVAYNKGVPSIKSKGLLITWSCKEAMKKAYGIELGKVVNYYKELKCI